VTLTPPAVDHAAAAYAALAPWYDTLTRDYAHDAWVPRLERLARRCGMSGRTALDVACGTGKSTRPLVALGYAVTACDISERMLAVARETLPDEVALVAADMRALPALGRFALVTCLNDAVNYLLEREELDAACAGFAAALAPGGALVFDVNTRAAHRAAFAETFAVEAGEVFLCWHGQGCDPAGPGEPGLAHLEVFARRGAAWRRERSSHRQRWWSLQELSAALAGAGLTVVAQRGQRTGGHLVPDPDEEAHDKRVLVARPLDVPAGDRKEATMIRRP